MSGARQTDKSPDAFRTISEVAEDLELPQHVLRFWETRFTQIKPIKRAGGRRFYRPEDVDLLRGVRHLLYGEGYTIKGVQRILKEQGIHYVQDLAIEEEAAGFQPMPPPVAARAEAPRRHAPPPEPYDEAPYESDMDQEPRRRSSARGQGEGAQGGFGGFLGLLPRRGKARAEPPVEEPPVIAELPFPEFSQHTRRHEAPVEPRLEPPPAPARPASVHPASVRPAATQRRAGAPAAPVEPRLDRDDESFYRRMPEPVYEDEDDEDDDRAEPYAPPRAAPSFAPEPRRAAEAAHRPVVPQRRPTRGPASRLPEPPPVPELEDPLLPFFDDDAFGPDGPQISEPLDARIRRLKEHAPGPPEEYIPARARRTEASHAEIPRAEVPRAEIAREDDREVTFRADMRDGERHPPPGPARGIAPAADDWPREWREEELRSAPDLNAEPRASHLGAPPPRADDRRDSRRADAYPPSRPPVVPAGEPLGKLRLGPLTGPVEEFELEDPEPLRWDHHQGFRPESVPREPHRPGPPEQYLPPHLRSDPRVAGAPPAPIPVLSRDDVHRLQATLYELGECRRLLGGAVERPDDSSQ